MFNIGFTGSRSGMTLLQKERVSELIQRVFKHETGGVNATHGVCLGSDEDFHYLVLPESNIINIFLRPGYFTKNPEDTSLRAKLELNSKCILCPEKPHFERNRDIVSSSNLIIGTPSHNNRGAGGTWYTLNYAVKIGKPSVVIFNDGTIEYR